MLHFVEQDVCMSTHNIIVTSLSFISKTWESFVVLQLAQAIIWPVPAFLFIQYKDNVCACYCVLWSFKIFLRSYFVLTSAIKCHYCTFGVIWQKMPVMLHCIYSLYFIYWQIAFHLSKYHLCPFYEHIATWIMYKHIMQLCFWDKFLV